MGLSVGLWIGAERISLHKNDNIIIIYLILIQICVFITSKENTKEDILQNARKLVMIFKTKPHKGQIKMVLVISTLY